MWSLETLISLNDKVASGASVNEAFASCGISSPHWNPGEKKITVSESKEVDDNSEEK